MERDGVLTPYYIGSRKLYRVEDIKALEGKIERGELAKPLRGAARSRRRCPGEGAGKEA